MEKLDQTLADALSQLIQLVQANSGAIKDAATQATLYAGHLYQLTIINYLANFFIFFCLFLLFLGFFMWSVFRAAYWCSVEEQIGSSGYAKIKEASDYTDAKGKAAAKNIMYIFISIGLGFFTVVTFIASMNFVWYAFSILAWMAASDPKIAIAAHLLKLL